jgi:hypothetical protein
VRTRFCRALGSALCSPIYDLSLDLSAVGPFNSGTREALSCLEWYIYVSIPVLPRPYRPYLTSTQPRIVIIAATRIYRVLVKYGSEP